MQLLLWAKSNLYISVPALIIALFILRELLFFKLKRHFRIYTFLVFPGVVIHEFSHVVACLITGAKIKDVEFFGESGGHVTHTKPKLKYVGTFLVSIAPLITGILFMLVLSPLLYREVTGFGSYIAKFLIFYLLTTVIITMFPSSKDFSNAFFIYLILIALSLGSAYFFKNIIKFGDKIVLFLLSCIAVVFIANFVVFIFSYLSIRLRK